jgi:serine/threonine-protein kinase
MAADQDSSGTLLGGRYRLRGKLGAGGMGVVYEAWQEDLSRSVAVKLMTGADPESLLRFQREARAAASLGHPHIVQIFDFQSGTDPPFLVMELVAGQSLRDLVRSAGPLEEDRAARLAVQLLSALEAAHQAGILHRDVKPANVLVTTSPTMGEIAKVLDFGIAKLEGPNAAPITRHGSVLGTLAYMSPEQARGEPLDGRSDVYSLASTIFFACTGERALPASSSEELLTALVEGRTRRLAEARPGLDPVFASIVERGLQPVRDARFRSAQEMADLLSQWLERRGALGALRSSSPVSAAGSVVASVPGSPLALSHGPVTAVAPASRETAVLGPPAPPRQRASGALLGAGFALGLGVVAAGVLAAAAAGYYFLVHETEPGVPSAAPSAPDVAVPGSSAAPVAPSVTGAQPPTSKPKASPQRAAAAATATAPAAAEPTAAPTATPSAEPAAKPPAPGVIGAPCSGSGDCTGKATCSGGKCVCPGTVCAGVCVDTKWDKQNCGQCGRACPGENLCEGGSCVSCSPPRALCGGRCINTSVDLHNCGGCGKKCTPGLLCWQGVCKKN